MSLLIGSMPDAPRSAPPSHPRRLLVIYNAAAGIRPQRRLARFLDHVERLGAEAELRRTARRGDAEAFARSACGEAFDAVVAAGGDGTVNEVVNGLGDSDMPLAVLPLGTGNVLANELELPRDARRLARLAAFGTAFPIWPGLLGTRRFVMLAGIGFDAAVIAGLDEGLKRRVGKLAFALAILGELRRYEPRRYDVQCSAGRYRAASAVVVTGRFYAGRFVLAPRGRIADRQLTLVLFMRTGRWAALRYLVALGLGRIHRLPDVRTLPAGSVAIGTPVEGDGDILTRLPVEIRLADRPLRVVRPD